MLHILIFTKKKFLIREIKMIIEIDGKPFPSMIISSSHYIKNEKTEKVLDSLSFFTNVIFFFCEQSQLQDNNGQIKIFSKIRFFTKLNWVRQGGSFHTYFTVTLFPSWIQVFALFLQPEPNISSEKSFPDSLLSLLFFNPRGMQEKLLIPNSFKVSIVSSCS